MSTATRATRSRKMTKEDNTDIVAADTASTEATAKVPHDTDNNLPVLGTSTAGDTVTAATDKSTLVAGHSEGANDADKINTNKVDEGAVSQEASANPASATGNAGEGSMKQDANMTEVNGAAVTSNDTVAGDVELTANFPQKLMEILSNEEYTDIIHWLHHGKGFVIANKKRFADEVLPKYFKKAKFTSFTRKLNRWNFVRITRGPEVGSYFHPNFQKNDLLLVSQMTCIGSKQPQAVKPLDPIALGVVPMGEAIETATEALGGIQQWQRQDHERYRLFYQQNHWNYMMQMMQQASAAKSQQDPDPTAAGTSAATEESTVPVKTEDAEVGKAQETKVEANASIDEPSSQKAEL